MGQGDGTRGRDAGTGQHPRAPGGQEGWPVPTQSHGQDPQGSVLMPSDWGLGGILTPPRQPGAPQPVPPSTDLLGVAGVDVEVAELLVVVVLVVQVLQRLPLLVLAELGSSGGSGGEAGAWGGQEGVTAGTAPTWRYRLRATGWFCSVMKKVPRFSSFFRCSTTV